jgi:hypothetical protein
MPEIRFDELKHVYTVDGKKVPSVTTILSTVGLPDLSMVPPDLLEWKAGLGTAVHKATELDDRGVIDRYEIDPETVPYIEAYRRFKQESGFVPQRIEEIVYNQKCNYIGTFDRIGFINDKYSLVDFKTGVTDPKCVGPQTAAYVEATGLNPKRYALKLNKDGTYKLVPLTNKLDFQIFLNALNIYNWRQSK